MQNISICVLKFLQYLFQNIFLNLSSLVRDASSLTHNYLAYNLHNKEDNYFEIMNLEFLYRKTRFVLTLLIRNNKDLNTFNL